MKKLRRWMALPEGCFLALRNRLLSRFSSHRHAEKKRQNAAGQNGQDQIDKIGGKGQNGRKPQQCDKKRYPHNGHEQILFCFWFHDDIPFPEPVAANCKSPSADSFIVL